MTAHLNNHDEKVIAKKKLCDVTVVIFCFCDFIL